MNLYLQNGDFIDEIDHRPWLKPTHPWIIYQEWNDALFMHWKVDQKFLREMVPTKLELETFEDQYWVSIVVFRLEKARPRFLPHIPVISNFHEINVRTYVRMGDKRGVYFLDIEAENWISCKLANAFSGLNYRKSTIEREKNKNQIILSNSNSKRNFSMKLDYKIAEQMVLKPSIVKSLTELYSVYVENNGKYKRFQVHHKEWDIYGIRNEKIELDYQLGSLELNSKNLVIAHYSPGVQVVAWNREYL